MKRDTLKLFAIIAASAVTAAADVVVEETSTGFVVRNGDVRRTLDFYGPNTMRVKTDLGRDHWKHPSLAIVAKPSPVPVKMHEVEDGFTIDGTAFTVSIDRKTGALTFSDTGRTLLREPSEPCSVSEKEIDGEPTYEVTQRWKLTDDEGLYGLGQAASGKFNLRGQKIKIVQTNIPAFSPVWSSSKGYMILWDVYSQSIFNDRSDGLELWGESAPGGSDWYFMYGRDPDRRFAEYRMLTGAAPMFPKAAFGYFQSKERYKTAQELIDVVARFRSLGYPIDWIVQDWQYWDARHERWNAMQWDESRYPDPKGLCNILHNDLHVKLITSIWPDVGDDTDVARELDAHGLRYAPGHWTAKNRSHVYDAYSKLGREIYFKHLKKGLIDVGVDAMWMDGSELETRDACHNADKMVEQIKACGRNEMGDFTRYLNTYGLVTTMGNYEGQRATSDRRTFTLTRSAWAGLQRYGAIPWSGDTIANWNRLKDEIAGGLGASMSGLPYWTQDTGGFFCRHYGDAMNNPEYLELLARWNQFAIFNPVYRWHVSSPVVKEPFRAKEKYPEYYESFLSAARLRYRLLPYIYSLARDVHETGRPFVRPVWIDYPETPGATDDQTSIVFGPSLYTSVITRPIYTGNAAGSGSPVPSDMLTTPDGSVGVKVEYFRGQDLKEKVSETVVAQVNDTWPGPPLVEWPEGLSGGDNFSCRYTGHLTLFEPGVYELGIEGDDGFALWLDGEEKFRDWAKRAVRSKATRVTVPEGGKTFDLRIDYFNDKFARSIKFWMRTPEEVAKLEKENRKIEVVLPVGADWFDFRTGERFAGGSKLPREYPIDSFPLFVKAGTILPLGPDVQYATEKTDKPIELRVYPGADASFTLYFDDNETYAYEKGAFEKITLTWNDAECVLSIGAREGSYPRMQNTREFRVVLGDVSKTVRYDGTPKVVALCALSAVAAPTLEEGFCPSAERGEAAHVVSHDERQHREGGHHTRLQGAREGGRRREDAEFRAALADPLAWLYADSRVDAVEGMDEIDVPANGVIDANILLNGLTPGEPLEFHATLPEGEWYRMRAVPVRRNTGATGFLEMKPGDNPHVARRAPFEVFDVLEPLPCKMAARSQNASAFLTAATIDSPRETEALRFRLECVPGKVEPRVIRFCVTQGKVTRELSLKVNVHPVALPPVGKDSFKYTNWMYFDSMAASHGLKPWSEEHWKMIEKYVRLAVRGRQNIGLMRDVVEKDDNGEVHIDKERFSRFLDLYDRVGIWYLEGWHLASFSNGWGSPTFNTRDTTYVTTTVEGALALSKQAKMFMKEIETRGLKDRWYQHVADEPGGKNIGEYRITAGIVRRYMPGIRMLDAVVSPSFAGALDVWCPTVDSFELHRAQYDSFRTNFGDRVWCYTCCVPGGKWMNRTMDGELLRPVLIPWVAVMWDIDGFLHWGYNRWKREQGQDPFTEPYPKKWYGLNDGNSLPPGDTHIVYPGADGPWPSVRLEATRAGMEDADLLTLLRRRDKAQADGVVTRIARGFRDYTPSCKLYREVRRDLLRRIEQEGTGSNSR